MKRRFSLHNSTAPSPEEREDAAPWWRRLSMLWSTLLALVLHGVLFALMAMFWPAAPTRPKRKIVLIRRVLRAPRPRVTQPRPRPRLRPRPKVKPRPRRRLRRRVRRRRRRRIRRARRRKRPARRRRRRRRTARRPVPRRALANAPSVRKRPTRPSQRRQPPRDRKGRKLDILTLMPSLTQKQKSAMRREAFRARGGGVDKKGQYSLAKVWPKYHHEFKRREKANRGLYDRFYENIADQLRLCIRRNLPDVIARYNKMNPQGKRQSKGFQKYSGSILLAWNADGKFLYPILKQKRKVSPVDHTFLRKKIRKCLRVHTPPKRLLGKKTLRARWRYHVVVGVTPPTLTNLISLITMWKTVASVTLWTEAIY